MGPKPTFVVWLEVPSAVPFCAKWKSSGILVAVPPAGVTDPYQSPKSACVALTVIAALLITVGVCTEATWTVAEPLAVSAVNKPLLLTVPFPATLHVTAVLKFPVPDTVAVNCCCCPAATLADDGAMLMDVACGCCGRGGATADPPPPPPTPRPRTRNNHPLAL